MKLHSNIIRNKGTKAEIQNLVSNWINNNDIHGISRIEYTDDSKIELVPDTEANKQQARLKKQLQDYLEAEECIKQKQAKKEKAFGYWFKVWIGLEDKSDYFLEMFKLSTAIIQIKLKLEKLKLAKQHKVEIWQVLISYKPEIKPENKLETYV